jgi:hypothetical protein
MRRDEIKNSSLTLMRSRSGIRSALDIVQGLNVKINLMNSTNAAMPTTSQSYQEWYAGVETNHRSRTDQMDTSAKHPYVNG